MAFFISEMIFFSQCFFFLCTHVNHISLDHLFIQHSTHMCSLVLWKCRQFPIYAFKRMHSHFSFLIFFFMNRFCFFVFVMFPVNLFGIELSISTKLCVIGRAHCAASNEHVTLIAECFELRNLKPAIDKSI